ncbi:hypothetical protein ES708_24210 [subsurface metagenome]
MDYQVWTKEEFGETYTKVDCGDIAAARREVDKAVRAGAEPLLTVEVPYSLAIKVEEPGSGKPKSKVIKRTPETKGEEEPKSEASQGEAPAGEGPGAESKG